jgi:hypothetical protein
MSKILHEMTGSLPRGAHACHLFSTAGEQKQILLPFCQQGLKRNEFVSLTASADTIDDWQLELQAYGIDVQAERERGALMIKAIGEPSEHFNPVRQARNLWRMVQPMLERFPAARLLRAQPWSAEALTIEDLCHFELTKNLLFQDTDVCSVCQYDLSHHSPQAIHTALRTHPLVILDGMLRENPFYDGDAILKQEPSAFGSDADAQAVEQMLASFR